MEYWLKWEWRSRLMVHLQSAHSRVDLVYIQADNWLIEILSTEKSANRVIKKILFVLQQGTELVWLFYKIAML